jgi:hypothetical protein
MMGIVLISDEMSDIGTQPILQPGDQLCLVT